jgi:hypothetical protein
VEPRLHLVPHDGGAGHFNVLRGHLAPAGLNGLPAAGVSGLPAAGVSGLPAAGVSGVKVVGDFVYH